MWPSESFPPLEAMSGKGSGMRADSISMTEDWNLARQQPAYPRGITERTDFSQRLSHSPANIIKTLR